MIMPPATNLLAPHVVAGKMIRRIIFPSGHWITEKGKKYKANPLAEIEAEKGSGTPPFTAPSTVPSTETSTVPSTETVPLQPPHEAPRVNLQAEKSVGDFPLMP